MSYVLTLAASPDNPDISDELISTIKHNDSLWLNKNRAIDLLISEQPDNTALEGIREKLQKDRIDLFINPAQNRKKNLLIADMDSTIVEGETLDDLAEHAGLKNKVSAITQRAMEGKLDFHSALKERVALLKDLPTEKLQETLDKTALNPGAETFVRTMRKHGVTCVLVSGGFTFFTQAIAKKCGFHNNHGNTLDVSKGKLLGTVGKPILDKHAKVKFLKHYVKELNLTENDVLSIGDGANDIPMLQMATMGIGYRPKPAVTKAVPNLILYGDLTAALYAQGYTKDEFILL